MNKYVCKKKKFFPFFCRMLSMVHCTSLGSYCTLRWSDRQLVGTGSESPRNSSPRLARSCWSCMMSPPSSSTTSSCLPVEKITSLKRVGLNLLCSLFRFKDWSNYYTCMFSFQYHIISTIYPYIYILSSYNVWKNTLITLSCRR